MDSPGVVPLARVGKVDGCTGSRDDEITVDHVSNFSRKLKEWECVVNISDIFRFAEDFGTLVHVLAFGLSNALVTVMFKFELWYYILPRDEEDPSH